MTVCPYCAKDVNALKNHVRLSSGGGHGPSGSYPDDFNGGVANSPADDRHAHLDAQDDGSPLEEDEGTRNGTGAASADQSGESDTVSMSAEEFDDAIQTAKEIGMEEGTEVGFETGNATAEKNETHPPKQPDPGPCPSCGGELVDFRGTDEKIENGRAFPTPFDFLCSQCAETFDWATA